MHQRSISQLNLLALPSLDLLSPHGWGVVDQLPDEPGCYACVCTVGKRYVVPIQRANTKQVVQATLNILGEQARPIVQATERGQRAAVIMYIGYSKDLNQRWAGRSAHHKQADLRLMGYLMNTAFDVLEYRLHWLRASSGEQAKAIETRLIQQWQPVLNGRAPLINQKKVEVIH